MNDEIIHKIDLCFQTYLFNQAFQHKDWKDNIAKIKDQFPRDINPVELIWLLDEFSQHPAKFKVLVSLIPETINDNNVLQAPVKFLKRRNTVKNFSPLSEAALIFLEKFPQSLSNDFYSHPLIIILKQKDSINNILTVFFNKFQPLMTQEWFNVRHDKFKREIYSYMDRASYTDLETNPNYRLFLEKIIDCTGFKIELPIYSGYTIGKDGFSDHYEPLKNFNDLNVLTRKIVFLKENNLMDLINENDLQKYQETVLKKTIAEITKFVFAYLPTKKFLSDILGNHSLDETAISEQISQLFILNQANECFNCFSENFQTLKKYRDISQDILDEFQQTWHKFFHERIVLINDAGDRNFYSSVNRILAATSQFDPEHKATKNSNAEIAIMEKILLGLDDISKKYIKTTKAIL